MQIGPEAQKAARIARESQEVIAEPSLRDADDYRIYLKEAIADIQKVVAETHVSGSKGDRLDEKLEAFAEAVREELERLATPGASHAHDILSVIPAHKESLKEDVLEALRVHLIGFFRANENELSGSIFETPLTEEQKRARSHYVQEFIANFGAHVFAVEKLGWHMNVADWPSFLQRSAEDPPAAEATEFTRSAIRRLATRKMAEFSRDFFYGPYVHATLQKAISHFPPRTKRTFSLIVQNATFVTKYWVSLTMQLLPRAKHGSRLVTQISSQSTHRGFFLRMLYHKMSDITLPYTVALLQKPGCAALAKMCASSWIASDSRRRWKSEKTYVLSEMSRRSARILGSGHH